MAHHTPRLQPISRISRASARSERSQRKADTMNTLQRLGANRYDRWLPESHGLSQLLMDNEIVEGVIYGRYRLTNDQPPGRGMLVATDKRIMFLDRKPLFMRASEIAYDVVSGIAQSHAGFSGVVTLSTRLGDISVRHSNQRCANGFVQAIETHIFRRRSAVIPSRDMPLPY